MIKCDLLFAADSSSVSASIEGILECRDALGICSIELDWGKADDLQYDRHRSTIVLKVYSEAEIARGSCYNTIDWNSTSEVISSCSE